MERFRLLMVMVALGLLLFVMMAVQSARDRAHQQPLGARTMGQQRR